jgi:pyridoxamine 5'-phosphate oxidase
MTLAELRREYSLHSLDIGDVAAEPIAQFRRWFDDARAAEIIEPNAMTLATCRPAGTPSARIVLLKDVSDAGFVFFTQYRSRKGQELEANPRVALVFFWKEIERQVRIVGTALRVTDAENAAYFAQRPRGARLGAWASHQSTIIQNRNTLEAEALRAEARFAKNDVPCPPYWGGYRVSPSEVEFWQGRPNRLHDRLRYRRNDEGQWVIERLQP